MSKVIEILKNMVSGKGIIEQVGEVADKFITTEAEREQFRIEMAKIVAGDAGSAREMQKSALAQDDKFAKRFVYFLAAFLMVFGCGYILAVTFLTVPLANTRFADTMTGVVITMVFSSVVGYFFGSSAGSRDKMEMFFKNKDKS